MIEINNLTTNLVDKDFLKRVAKKVLKGENNERELSIALVGQGRIRALNKKYRRKNRATDVLAFGQNQRSKTKNQKFPTSPGDELGEVVICLREVNKNAKHLGYAFEKELAGVLIHGILHLLGYDHEGDKQSAGDMKKKEEYYLSKLKI